MHGVEGKEKKALNQRIINITRATQKKMTRVIVLKLP
jgi:hypothetical protein